MKLEPLTIYSSVLKDLSIYGSLRDIEDNVFDWDIILNKFELQSIDLVHFRINKLKRGIHPLISPSSKLNSATTGILRRWILHS